MTESPVLISTDQLLTSAGEEYDGFRDLSKYLLMHYGSAEETFADPTHPLVGAHGFVQRLSQALLDCSRAEDVEVSRALDVGCNVGGLSHLLAAWVSEEVVGVDLSPSTIETANRLTAAGSAQFAVITEGADTVELSVDLPEPRARLRFEVGTAEKLSIPPQPFDAIVLSNVLDRVSDPAACLRQFVNDALLAPGGLLMIACPWSWYVEYADPAKWLGDFEGNQSSEDALKEIMSRDFELLLESETGGVLRQNLREYDYFEAHTTVWRRH